MPWKIQAPTLAQNRVKIQLKATAAKKALALLGGKHLPEATAEVLNWQAKGSQNLARRNTKTRMTVRTQYTIKSTKQDRSARGHNINRMFSRVANISPYLGAQDEGESQNRKSVPTVFSRRNKFKNQVKRSLRKDKLGKFGWKGKTESSYFIGRPKGGKRASGIWMRHRANKRLHLVHRMTQADIKIKPTQFFTDAIREYSKEKNLEKKWQRVAKRRLRGS